MRIGSALRTIVPIVLLAFIASPLTAQFTTQAQQPGDWTCCKCLRHATGIIGICQDAQVDEMGREFCNDSNWDCQLSGMSCATIPDLGLLIDSASPTRKLLDGTEVQLAAVGRYLWAGSDCEHGVLLFQSAAPDQAVDLVALNATPLTLALE